MASTVQNHHHPTGQRWQKDETVREVTQAKQVSSPHRHRTQRTSHALGPVQSRHTHGQTHRPIPYAGATAVHTTAATHTCTAHADMELHLVQHRPMASPGQNVLQMPPAEVTDSDGSGEPVTRQRPRPVRFGVETRRICHMPRAHTRLQTNRRAPRRGRTCVSSSVGQSKQDKACLTPMCDFLWGQARTAGAFFRLKVSHNIPYVLRPP